jgi:tetrahydromethanopterin S-methyltransferase subunit F
MALAAIAAQWGLAYAFVFSVLLVVVLPAAVVAMVKAR